MKARMVREKKARGFHAQALEDGETMFVKNGFHLVPCTGDAHTNANIDGCMICLRGTWGWMVRKVNGGCDELATSEDDNG